MLVTELITVHFILMLLQRSNRGADPKSHNSLRKACQIRVCIFKSKFAQTQKNDRSAQCSIFTFPARLFYSTFQMLWLRSMICQRSKAESGSWKTHNTAGSQLSLDHRSPLGQTPLHFHQSLLTQSKRLSSWKRWQPFQAPNWAG